MKGIERRTGTFLTAAFLIVSTCLFAVSVRANVCSQGTGIPPFLSSGTKPNLLMLLDNSGSMLDMAYSSDRVDSTCLDGDYEIVSYDNQGNQSVEETVTGYEPGTVYGGYFESNKWYKWTTGDLPQWQNNTVYTPGTWVYEYGNIYEASCPNAVASCTSSGINIEEDTGVDWDQFFYIAKWANNRDYPAGSFVWSGPQLYYTETGGTSLDPDDTNGFNLPGDTAIDWTPVDSNWLSTSSYVVDDIVSYNGTYYQSEVSCKII